jgi:hypothetical protein
MSNNADHDFKVVFDEVVALDLSKCTLAICLASIVKGEIIPRFARLQITDDLTKKFCEIIEQLLSQYRREWNEDDLLFREFADESIPPEYEIEGIDLTNCPAILEQLVPLKSPSSIDVFAEDKRFISDLRFYAIVAQSQSGDPIYFFSSYEPEILLEHSFKLALWKHNGTYDRIHEPVVLFDQRIDCISKGNIMLILHKNKFNDIFRFFEEIKKAAKETLETIKICIPIKNFEDFARDCERHLTKQRKLNNIGKKKYLNRLSIDHLKKVITQNNLPIKIVEENGAEVILYDPKNKWILLNLLNDDYLWSMLTETNYEVTGKREM